ncbi:MAG: cadherin-like beta sandwich domain-containing protein [Prevotellaceae bacterium]|nr:cadherin-like beta sandwich domain-containing protein [Prevotellaceae bacterium]
MKNISLIKSMVLASCIAGFTVHAKAQTDAALWEPDLNAEYFIREISTSKLLTYAGTGQNLYSVFSDASDIFNQAWRFVEVEGNNNNTTTEYYIVAAKIATEDVAIADLAHLNDNGVSIVEPSPTWHAIRVFKDKDNKFAIRLAGSENITQKMWAVNSGNSRIAKTGGTMGEPPTDYYLFSIEKITDYSTVDLNNLQEVAHAQAVVNEITAQQEAGITVFGVGGRYQGEAEALYTTLKSTLTSLQEKVSSIHAVWPLITALQPQLNALFAAPTISAGDYYLRNSADLKFLWGRIYNNKGSTIRGYFTYDKAQKDNHVFTFLQSYDNGPVLVKYKDIAEINSGTVRYLGKNTQATTSPSAADSLVFYYDISTGFYAAQFVNNGGFIYNKGGNETNNSGNNNTLSESFFLFSLVSEDAGDELYSLNAAMTAAQAKLSTLTDADYYYDEITSLLAESKEIWPWKYDTPTATISEKCNRLLEITYAFRKNVDVTADKWVAKKEGNAVYQNHSQFGKLIGGSNGSDVFHVGNYDFSQGLDTIVMVYGNEINTGFEIYAGDYNNASNKIATITAPKTNPTWTGKTELRTTTFTNLPTTGILLPIYVKWVGQANIWLIRFAVAPPVVTVSANNDTYGSVTGGKAYPDGATAELTATATDTTKFVNWQTTGGVEVSTDNPLSIVVTRDTALVAHFALVTHSVAATVNNAEFGSITSPSDGDYEHGTSISFTATPTDTTKFVKWTALGNDVDVISTVNPLEVAVKQDTALVAHFALKTYNLTTAVNNSDLGSIDLASTANGDYDHGTLISLTATATDTSWFVNWTKNNEGEVSTEPTISFALKQATDLTANFVLRERYDVGVSANNPEYGSVTGGGSYFDKHTAKLEATATDSTHFVKWTIADEDAGNENLLQVLVTEATDVVAHFALNSYSFAARVNDDDTDLGSITSASTPNDTYAHGTPISLTATATDTSWFVNWTNTTNSEEVVSEDAELSFALKQATDLTANFVLRERYGVDVLANNSEYGSVTGGGSYFDQHTATLEATPTDSTDFKGWKIAGSDDIVSSKNPLPVVVTQDSSFVAHFALKIYSLATAVNDASLGGITYGAKADGSYEHGTVISLTAAPADTAWFVNWTAGGNKEVSTDAALSFALKQDTALTANFVLRDKYTVTASANRDDYGSVTGGGVYFDRFTATLKATPTDSTDFVRWTTSDGDAGSENPLKVVVTQDTVVEAHFALKTYSFSVKVNDGAMGSITSTEVDGDYDHGTAIKLVATPEGGMYFIAWRDTSSHAVVSRSDTLYLALVRDTHLEAVFSEENIPSYQVSAAPANPAYGSVTGSGEYLEGATAKLEATPTDSTDFVRWTTAGDVEMGTDNPLSIVVTQNSNFAAHFALKTYSFAATVSDANLGSITYGAVGNGTYEHGAAIELTATPADTAWFVNWTNTGGGEAVSAAATLSFALRQPTALTANFVLRDKYTVTASANEGEYGSVTGSGVYFDRFTAALEATPTDSTVFTGWTTAGGADVVSSENPLSFDVTQDSNFVAHFALKTYSFAVAVNDGSLGSITSTEANGDYAHGTAIELTATPTDTTVFAGWKTEAGDAVSQSATLSVVVTQDIALVAHFALKSYSFAVAVNDGSLGGVSSTPASGTYAHGAAVALTATPADTALFVSWTNTNGGEEVSTEATLSFALRQPTALTANFVLKAKYTVTASVSAESEAYGSVSGSGVYFDGATATLTATPANSEFTGWKNAAGDVVSTANPLSILVAQDTALIAGFAANLSSNSKLSSLTVSGGASLSPAFNPDTLSYTVAVANSVASITLTAQAAHAGATVEGSGVPHSLAVGANELRVVVTAEDGATAATYTVTVTRAAATPPTAVAAVAKSVLRAYPNPVVDGALTVENGALRAGDRIRVCSLSGVLLAIYEVSAGSETVINVSQLPQGLYIVKAGKYAVRVVVR